MKRTILTLFIALTTITLHAQQPKTVLQPSEIIAYGSSDYFNGNYYDGERISHFTYNETGALVKYTMNREYIFYEDLEADTVILQYDDNNNILTCDWFDYFSPSNLFWHETRYQYIYDDENRLSGFDSYDYWTHRIESHWVPYYDENNRVRLDSLYRWSYSYDTGAYMWLNMVRTKSYENLKNTTINEVIDENGNIEKYRITKTFFNDGRTKKIKRDKYENGVFVNKTSENFSYSNSRIAAVEEDSYDEGTGWTHYRKTVYTRDNNGQIALIEHQLWNGDEFVNYKRTLYERNDAGYPTVMTFQNYSGDVNDWVEGSALIDHLYYGKYNIDYDIPSFSNYKLVDSVFSDKHLRFIDSKCVTSYPVRRLEFSYIATPNPHYAVDEPICAPITIYPNPTKDIVYIEFSPDVDCQSVEIYNIDGRMVKTCHGASLQNNAIDISNINAGVYIMKIKMLDGKEFAERIIKE